MIRTISAFVLLVAMVCLLGCGDRPEPGFGQVSGKVLIDGQPAPEGTKVRFHQKSAGLAFQTAVQEDGTYSYRPPREAPLEEGDYLVSVEPVTTTTVVDDSGLTVSEDIPGAPKSYGKFSDPQQSGLEVSLSRSNVTYDIEITTR